jgi:putative membrane protein
MMNGGDWIVGILGLLFGVLVFAVIVMLIVRLARSSSETYMMRGDKPIEIAKARYAKGEITKHEFEQIKKDLAE